LGGGAGPGWSRVECDGMLAEPAIKFGARGTAWRV